MAKHEPIVELFYNSAWNDITENVYVRDPITFNHGRADESQQPAPATAAMTLKNTTGIYNPQNPASPLYGLIGRNTPLRVSLDKSVVQLVSEGFENANNQWAVTFDDQGNAAWGRSTAQAHSGSASLKSGTIADDQVTDAIMTIPGGATSLTFWYMVSSESGFDYFELYIDGIFQFQASGTVAWTQRTENVTNVKTVTFRYIKDGSIVAGDDAAYIDDITISGVKVHFTGEVSEWIPKRSLDGKDAWTQITASGITRRLGQGADPLQSSITRHAILNNAVAYWPLTDNKESLVAASGINGAPMTFTQFDSTFVTVYAGLPAFGSGQMSPYPWLPPVMATTGTNDVFSGGILGADVNNQPATTQIAFDVLYRATPGNTDGSLPMDGGFYLYTDTDLRWLWRPASGFTAIEVTVARKLDSASSTWSFIDGQTVTGLTDLFDGNTHHVRLHIMQTSVTAVHWDLYIDGVAVGNDDHTTATTIGRVKRVEIDWFTDPTPLHINPIHIGSLAVFSDGVGLPDVTDTFQAVVGHRTENAARRVQRLCGEEEISSIVVGDRYDSAFLGGQYADGLVGVFNEAAETDLGILTDTRHQIGLTYRTRSSIYNQTPVLALDFEGDQLSAPLDPKIDDQATRNDVTVTRRDGGTFRAVLEDGALSVQAPPEGIGRYTSGVTENVAADPFLQDQAGWRLHLGTIGETRYPLITIDLDAAPTLSSVVEGIRPGDLITIANLPKSFSPDLARLIIQGWTETLGSHRRIYTFNCTPASPWTVGIYGTAGVTPAVDEPKRYNPENSKTNTVFTSGTGTALTVQDGTGDVDLWSTTAAVPFDINVAGVRLRVTSISGASSPQTLTVQQSPINGVIKTIPALTPVNLWTPARYALGDRLMPKAGDIITARSTSESGISAASVGAFSTASTTYVNAGNPTSAASFSFTKIYAATVSRIKVFLMVGSRAGTVPATVDWAVRVNGVDYQILHYEHSTASAHETASGFAYITGIAAGTYTVQIRYKSPTGNTITVDSNDFFACNMEEIPV